MKNKRKLLLMVPLIIALCVFLGLYYYFNKEDENSFTISENKWIKENLNTIIDFDILNDYPVYGENGIFRTFINKFSDDTGFEFNIVPYLKESQIDSTGYRFRILNNQDKITENDLLLQEDVYILIGKDKTRIDNINELNTETIGILTADSEEIIYYLKSAKELKYKTYDNSDTLFQEYDSGSVDLIIIPNIMYLNKTILNENYNIKYVFTEISKKIVLTLADNENNEKMNNIVRKYFNKWKENYFVETYNKSLLDYYIENSTINDKEKTEFLTKNYIYGYVENYPYEVPDKNKISGIAAEYIKRMERLANTEFITFKKYDTIEQLKKAIDNKEVDIYFNYYDYENKNYNSTISPFIEKYSVIAKTKDNYVINSFESMKSQKVSIIENNSIYNYFKDNSKASLVPFENLDKLLKESNGNLIAIDKEIYNYHKDKKLKDEE